MVLMGGSVLGRAVAPSLPGSAALYRPDPPVCGRTITRPSSPRIVGSGRGPHSQRPILGGLQRGAQAGRILDVRLSAGRQRQACEHDLLAHEDRLAVRSDPPDVAK